MLRTRMCVAACAAATVLLPTAATHADPTGARPTEPACTIVGTPGNDNLDGTAGNDVICGLGGDDRLRGGYGNDILRGGAGDDTLVGDKGKDTLVGGSGDDVLTDDGADSLVSSTGDETRVVGNYRVTRTVHFEHMAGVTIRTEQGPQSNCTRDETYDTYRISSNHDTHNYGMTVRDASGSCAIEASYNQWKVYLNDRQQYGFGLWMIDRGPIGVQSYLMSCGRYFADVYYNCSQTSDDGLQLSPRAIP